MKRRHARFGRHLPTMRAALFLPNMPQYMRGFMDGLTLVETTRPYLTRRGAVNVRLVFRDRTGDVTHTVHWTLEGELDAPLAAALAQALPRGLRIGATPAAAAKAA